MASFECQPKGIWAHLPWGFSIFTPPYYARDILTPMSLTSGIRYLPSWVRWILVLPVAGASYLVVQLIVAVVLSLADLMGQSNWPHSMSDLVSQITNSFAGPYCFVFTGAFMAPSHKRYSAIALTVLGIALMAAVMAFGLVSDPSLVTWKVIASTIIGIVACAVAYAHSTKDVEDPSVNLPAQTELH